jgi:hypothetical protein
MATRAATRRERRKENLAMVRFYGTELLMLLLMLFMFVRRFAVGEQGLATQPHVLGTEGIWNWKD